ncbi:MAG TPA: hypothetical protein VGT03_09735 [Candidatus Acidoferrales bacterium]|nr:hypothetical protein [Candidatus Acidoferrales bacterium]
MAKATQPLAPKTPQTKLSSRGPDLGRHARKCAICNHPEREAIEREFLRWCEPAQIVCDYRLPCITSIYHHAHATGLLARRRRSLRGVAERILEYVDTAQISGSTVLQAMRIYAHITEDGQWIEPPKEFIVTHIHKFEPREPLTVASAPAPQRNALNSSETEGQSSASDRNNGLGGSPEEILIATVNASREEPSD